MKKKKKGSIKKQKVVKRLVTKAGLALKNEFYLEASWVLSSIIESKLRRILTLITQEDPGPGFGLQKCLNRIKFLYLKGSQPLLVKHFEMRLIDELRSWKSHRNSIYKDMIKIHVSARRIKKMTEEGIVLHQELTTVYKNFKKEIRQDLPEVTALPVRPDEQATP